MSRGIYAIGFTGIVLTNAAGDQDIWEFQPIAERPIELVGFKLSQSTDLQDAEEEGLRINIIRGNTTVGTGGTAITPAPMDPRDAAAGFTADRNNTGIATSGTELILDSESWNIRTTMLYLPIPENRPKADAASGNAILVVRLMAAPVDDVTAEGVAWVREL